MRASWFVPTKRTSNELRCFCTRNPLLATYGIYKDQLYIHIKVYKQSRVYGEILVTGGTVKIHCRECLRWHTVRIVQPSVASLEETDEPVVPR